MPSKQHYIDKIKLIANSINTCASENELDELIECASCLRKDIDSENKCLYVIVYNTERNGESVRIHRFLGKTTYEKAQHKLRLLYDAGSFGYIRKISEDERADFVYLYYLCKIDACYMVLKQYYGDKAPDKDPKVLNKIEYLRKKLRLYSDNEYVELDW